ncbi:MAG TPA: nitrilase-related carbon-nitrogen hydrolase [Bacteroidota bacterium]|nr:nitrilase-related carbon-nitrogen hydrolase [Bacteroidota bacterium]
MKHLIALGQIDPVLGDLKKNVSKQVEFTKRAIDGGADLIIFPELSLTGYSVKDMNAEMAVRPGHPLLEPLAKASKDITIITGGIEESLSFGIYNSAFCFEKGAASVVHRKVYLPTYGMFEEMRQFSPGKTARPFDSRVGTVGVLICEDLWHMSMPYLMALQNAWAIIGIAASPTRLAPGEKDVRIAAINAGQHMAYARLLSTYVIYCNRVGYEDGVNFWGGSLVVGPDGELLVQAKQFDEDLVFAEINTDSVRRARRVSRHFLDEDPNLLQRELRRISQQK